MYYVLKCLPPISYDHYRLKVLSEGADRRWEAGLPFAVGDHRDELRPPLTPLQLTTEAEPGGQPNEYAELYWNPLPLMSRRLVEALRSAGVDNLQVYDSRLEIVDTPRAPPPDWYLAVNIVGRIEAANLRRSRTNPDAPERLVSKDFLSLSIDEEKTGGALMFRLAESVTTVLVHAEVKAHVEAAGIATLTWFEPESYAG